MGYKRAKPSFKGLIYIQFTEIPVQIRLVLEISGYAQISDLKKGPKTAIHLYRNQDFLLFHSTAIKFNHFQLELGRLPVQSSGLLCLLPNSKKPEGYEKISFANFDMKTRRLLQKSKQASIWNVKGKNCFNRGSIDVLYTNETLKR